MSPGTPNLLALVADDEPELRLMLAEMLRTMDIRSVQAADGSEALRLLAQEPINLVICDIFMPHMDGTGFLRKAREQNPEVPVLMVSAHGTIQLAVELMQAGAYDFIPKPIDLDDLRSRMRRVVEHLTLKRRVADLDKRLRDANLTRRMVTQNAKMEAMLGTVPRIAATDVTVLITGESGSGKEMLARLIHDSSARRDREFVALNCGAIPGELVESELFGHTRGAFTGADRQRDGLVAAAERGTLFLDEAGELPLSMQVKFLRFLQEREYRPVGASEPVKANVRIIAATNRNLEAAVQAGQFREDLYYRLNVMELRIPPLRERKADIPLLVHHLTRKIADDIGKPTPRLHAQSLQKLSAYDWPGNIRELENVLWRALLLADGDEITPSQIELPNLAQPGLAAAGGLPFGIEALAEMPYADAKQLVQTHFDKAYAELLMNRHKGNVSQAARAAGKDRKNFYELLERAGYKDRATKYSGKDPDPEPSP